MQASTQPKARSAPHRHISERSTRVASIRSIERALEVLVVLNQFSVCSLDTLHKQTHIPKPTLVRILDTFKLKGLVADAPQWGAYTITSGVKSLAAGYHGIPRIVEASKLPMDNLTRLYKWPVALAIPHDGAAVVRYSTIPLSPVALLHSSIDMRLSLVSRALGRAYLAFCTQRERQALLEHLSASRQAEDAIAADHVAAKFMLAQVRKQGYALRSPGVRPVSNTLAVPVYSGRSVIASMGLTWISSAMTNEQAIKKFLVPLKEASDFISERLARL